MPRLHSTHPYNGTRCARLPNLAEQKAPGMGTPWRRLTKYTATWEQPGSLALRSTLEFYLQVCLNVTHAALCGAPASCVRCCNVSMTVIDVQTDP